MDRQHNSTREGEEDQEKVEHYDPQAGAREAIVIKRRQELRSEGLELPDEEEKPSDQEADQKAEDDKPEEEQEETEQKETEQEETEQEEDETEQEEMVEIKVDGEVERVKQSEVDAAGGVRALQKERAADKRLQEAAKRQKELDEREQRLAEKEKAGQSAGEPEKPEEITPKLDKAKVVELINKINYGDAEEAADAWLELQEAAGQSKGSAPKEVDTQAIAEQVRMQVRGEEVMSRFTAAPEKGGFGDLMDTRFAKIPTTLDGKVYQMPGPFAVARAEVDRLVKEDGADPTAWETYERAGKYAREQFGLQSSDPTKDGKSKKQQRKRQTDHPRGATPPQQKGDDVEKSIEDSRKSALNEIAASRQEGAV